MKKNRSSTIVSFLFIAFVAAMNGFGDGNDADTIIFSHQKHIKDAGAACADCHKATAESAGGSQPLLPKMTDCAACHQEAFDAKNCKMCHTNFAKAKPFSKVRTRPTFSHKAHLGRGAECATCHKGLENVVGPVTVKNMPVMDNCLTCHNDKKASPECSLCHSDLSLIKPATHKTVRFLKEEHGRDARFSSVECEKCHRQTWCDQCHLGQLSTRIHSPNYLATHGREAERGDKNCALCHEVQNQCEKCHAGRGR
jgi:c(7)-type cytochrome triheme protein